MDVLPIKTNCIHVDELARLFTGSNAQEGEVDVVTSSDDITEGSVPGDTSNGIDLVSSAKAGEILSGVLTPPVIAETALNSVPAKLVPSPPNVNQEHSSTLDHDFVHPTDSDGRQVADLVISEVSHLQIDAPAIVPNLTPETRRLQHPLFSVDQLRVDRRLLLNRKRQLKMYRVWMQAKFRKL